MSNHPEDALPLKRDSREHESEDLHLGANHPADPIKKSKHSHGHEGNVEYSRKPDKHEDNPKHHKDQDDKKAAKDHKEKKDKSDKVHKDKHGKENDHKKDKHEKKSEKKKGKHNDAAIEEDDENESMPSQEKSAESEILILPPKKDKFADNIHELPEENEQIEYTSITLECDNLDPQGNLLLHEAPAEAHQPTSAAPLPPKA